MDLASPAATAPAVPAVGRRPWWFAAVLLPFVVVAVAYAYYGIFSHFLDDDEGYLMISVQGFLRGHPLYDAVFTQYGPLYYFYEWLLHGALGIPLTHDATRLLCIGHWIAAALLLGVGARTLMRSDAAGVFVFMQAMLHLAPVSNEPGHPQEIVACLLALSVLIAARPRQSWLSLAALGAICAVTAFIKVNVGAFLGLALLWWLRCQSSDRLNRPAWVLPCAIFLASAPFLLMRQHLAAEWCRNYAVVGFCALLTNSVVAWRFSAPKELDVRLPLGIACGFALPAALAVAGLVLTGSSLQGCLEGLLWTPLRMPAVALNPILIPNSALANAGVSMLTAGWMLLQRRDATAGRVLAMLKFVYGVVGCFWLIENSFAQLTFLLPWSWLILVPGFECSSRPIEPAKVFLSQLAAWQALQAYPIAGTQVALGTFLLIPIFTLGLRETVVAWSETPVAQRLRARMTTNTKVLLSPLGWTLLLYLFGMIWCTPHLARRAYTELTPLGLPGADRIRLTPETADVYQRLAHYLAAESDTFVTYPGVNSLYFWAGKRPPTQLNGTGWGQLTMQQQDRVLGALSQARRPLLVVHDTAVRRWKDAVPAPISHLVYFVKGQCREVCRVGSYIIYRPLPPTSETFQQVRD